jgi:hypothetical protein
MVVFLRTALNDVSFFFSDSRADRDVFNEKPTREEQTLASTALTGTRGPGRLATTAVIHTDKGDIQIRLFPDQAPKAVENFVGHAKSGYYENVIFHRVIKKFVSVVCVLLLSWPDRVCLRKYLLLAR